MSAELLSSSARLELQLKSDPAQIGGARRTIEEFCTREGLNAHAVFEVGLCFNEALANIIRHAYSGDANQPITVTAESVGTPPVDPRYPGPAVRVTIRDWGSGFNPGSLPPKPHDPLKPGGLGLICLKSLMDEVIFTPQADGMLLSMTRGNRPKDGEPHQNETAAAPPAPQEPPCPN